MCDWRFLTPDFSTLSISSIIGVLGSPPPLAEESPYHSSHDRKYRALGADIPDTESLKNTLDRCSFVFSNITRIHNACLKLSATYKKFHNDILGYVLFEPNKHIPHDPSPCVYAWVGGGIRVGVYMCIPLDLFYCGLSRNGARL